MNIVQFVFWILLMVLCFGCGTIANQDGDRKPYGGVAADYHLATGDDPNYAHGIGIGPWWFLDTPLSLVGDTLTLPFDAHYSHTVKAHEESLRRNPPDPDPLSGWKRIVGARPDKAIVEDYEDYFQKLPSNQKKELIVNDHMVQSFEDAAGNHAVQIKIVVHGSLRKHVLFYDNTNKRIRVMKYLNDHRLVEE